MKKKRNHIKGLPNFSLFKKCVICKEEKPFSEFCIARYISDGRANGCLVCVQKQKYEKWRNDPQYKEKLTQRTLEWYQNNKERALKRNKEYSKKYNLQPWARIPQNLQGRLAEKTKFRSRIGMKTPELKIYLESLFLDGMNWDNYGKVWQIRLIRPVNDFDLNDSGEVSKINHYTNLKPSFSPEFLKSQELLKK